MTDTKTCPTCKVEQPLTEFYKRSGTKDGLRSQCKTCGKAATMVWRENNREKQRATKKLWYENNREYSRVRKRERYATDIPYKLRNLIKSAVIRAIGKNHGRKESLELLGCTLEEYIRYLESKFTEGMTWENHSSGGWHIDHIKPLNENGTELSKEEKLKRLHYTNTQPLWAKDNYSKGNKAQAVIEEK